MAISPLFPALWSARITYFATLFSAFLPNATRQWEGEATMGNTVKIPTVDIGVTINDYSRTNDLGAPEDIDASTQDLVIDQEKSFNFALEDLDSVQSRIPGATLIDMKSMGAGRAVAQTIDNYVAAQILAIDAFGLSPPAAAFDLNFVADLDEWLTLQGLAQSPVVMIMPPELVKKIDQGIIAKTYGDAVLDRYFLEALGNDPTATPDGFSFNLKRHRVFVSNNGGLRVKGGNPEPDRTKTDGSVVYCYNPLDLALVWQVNRTEVYRPEKRFSTAVKGLFNYGGKVLNKGRFAKFIFNDASQVKGTRAKK